MKVSERQLHRLVEMGVGKRVQFHQELRDGWANTAFLVTCTDGDKVVVKIGQTESTRMMRCERASMETEVAALQLVAMAGDVPVPRVRYYDASRTFLESPYFIMDYIAGEAYDKVREGLTQSDRDTINRQLAQYCQRIQVHRGTAFGYFIEDKGWAPTWQLAFERLVDDVLADGREAGVDLIQPYSTIERLVARHTSVLGEVEVPQLVHWDLWDGNVFVRDKRVVGIIDFERSLWADPLIEYRFGKFADSSAFTEAYLGRQLNEHEAARRVLYDFYLDLILLIECTYRAYEDDARTLWAQDNFQAGLRRLEAL